MLPISVPSATPEPKRYRLFDGSLGSEYDALREVLRVKQAQLRAVEEQIEILQIRLQTAEGRPA
jgi:hypothetical protein